jgi:protein involved in polysaccharide export with SLBB domain
MALLTALATTSQAQTSSGRMRSAGSAAPAASATASTPSRDQPLLGPPIDATRYRLGPGDVLILAMPGVLEEGAITMVVDAEGGLVLPSSAGRVRVAGLTLEEARGAVGKALATLVRERAFALSLREPRRFKVYVVGAVARPGAYAASPVTRATEVIEEAGGVLPGGSRRHVSVVRSDSLELRADLVAFAHLGATAENPLLEGGDVIRVPMRGEEVGVFGGVAYPGAYEWVPGESVESAVALAGGLVAGAQMDKAWLRRAGMDARTSEPAAPAATLAAGDALFVPVTPSGTIHRVEVSGEVMFPGTYPIQPGLDTVAHILRQAGGFTPAANLAGARLMRPLTAPPAAAIPAPLEPVDEMTAAEAAEGATPTDFTPTDGLPIGSGSAGLIPPGPSRFTELPRTDREVGLMSRNLDGREVVVAWLADPTADSTRVADGDRLHVPRAEGRVRVDGRVRTPGWVPYTPGRELDDYVTLAGGYDGHADESQILIQRAGRPAQAERAKGSKPIQDGDTIWVPEKAPRSTWSYVREAVVFLAQVATVVIVVDQIVNQ